MKATATSKGTATPRRGAVAHGDSFAIGGALTVHRLGFGAMRLTGEGVWGPPKDHDEAIRVLRRAIELGVDFIDTADSYGPDVSEQLIAEALHPYPPQLVIATKAGFTRPGPNRWVENGRPEHLRRACEGSLKRLRRDRIDLLQLHRIDPKVPLADQLGTLRELQDEGKVRFLGLSEVSVKQLAQARRLVDVVSVQNRYSIADRASDDVLDYCERERIAFIPWFPLAAGDLTAPGGALDQLARRRGATMSQLALAWLLWRSPVILPIPGTSSVRHLEENLGAASLVLDHADLRELEATVAAARR
jgi:aryl-alcohol dehydrogenase-like predicted oxidoreductase